MVNDKALLKQSHLSANLTLSPGESACRLAASGAPKSAPGLPITTDMNNLINDIAALEL